MSFFFFFWFKNWRLRLKILFMPQFLYIVQSLRERTRCKIGITDNLERRLREYNSITGNSKDAIYEFLFACETENMRALENAVKEQFAQLREISSREIYFFNAALFDMYVDFIRGNEFFVEEVICMPVGNRPQERIVKKNVPSLASRKMTRKDLMQRAKRVKDDEFYTRLCDIEKEMACYPRETFAGKVVFCNCDDAVGETRTEHDSSAFALYFLKHFFELRLRKLICTHYGGQMDLFFAGAKGYVFTRAGAKEITKAPRGYTGSFSDPLSVKILKEEADLVCTNPPFSLAREFWQMLIESGKRFIILSNITNAINTAFIPFFKKHQAWAGYNRVDYFLNPRRQPVEASAHWFTNVPILERPRKKLLKLVSIEDIPIDKKRTDDSGILVVDGGFIPTDWESPFAVSVRPILNGVLECGYEIVQDSQYVPYFDGRRGFSRVLISRVPAVVD